MTFHAGRTDVWQRQQSNAFPDVLEGRFLDLLVDDQCAWSEAAPEHRGHDERVDERGVIGTEKQALATVFLDDFIQAHQLYAVTDAHGDFSTEPEK